MITRRLAQIRGHLKVTRAEMARRVGVSGPAWHHYELGENVPGGNVLAKLASMGFDLHWLLLGEGQMLRPEVKYQPVAAGQASPDSEMRPMVPTVADLLEAARWSRTEVELEVFWTLCDAYPSALTLDQIARHLEPEQGPAFREALPGVLTLLKMRGAISHLHGVPDRFQMSRNGAQVFPKDAGGHAGVFNFAVNAMARHIYPKLGGPSGLLQVLRIPLYESDMQDLCRRLQTLALELCDASSKPDAEHRAIVVLGAGSHLAKKMLE